VKPTDKHTRGYFPLRSKSTYANEYIQKAPLKDDYTYFPDQLRSKSNWFGRTTYENFYSNPNPEYFAKKVKNVEKLEENPDFSRQYGKPSPIQKPSTRMTSSPSPTRSVPPRSSWRPRRKDISWRRRESSLRTLTSRPSRPSSTPSPPPSIPTCDS
jgi:hypothetical protein